MKPILLHGIAVFALLASAARADTAPHAAASPAGEPAVAAPSAAPITLKVAGHGLVLAVPDGMCALDRSRKTDAVQLAWLEKNIGKDYRLLLDFADCESLNAQRAGKQTTLHLTGDVLAPIKAESAAEKFSRPEFITAAMAHYDQNAARMQASQKPGPKPDATPPGNPLGIEPQKLLGLLSSAPDYVIFGEINSAKSTGGAPMAFLNITALTKLGVPVVVTLSSTNASDESVRELTTRADAYMRKLVALNPDVPPNYLLVHLKDILAGVAICALIFFRLRRFLARRGAKGAGPS